MPRRCSPIARLVGRLGDPLHPGDQLRVASGYLLSGVLGQAIGRCTCFIGAGSVTVLVSAPAYYFAMIWIDQPGGFPSGMVFCGTVLVLSTSCYDVIHTYVPSGS